MAAPAALRLSFPRFPPALPPSLERRRPVLLLQSSAFIRRDSLSCSARNGKVTSDRGGGFIPGAYGTRPASDAIFSESDPKFSASETPEKEEECPYSLGLLSLRGMHDPEGTPVLLCSCNDNCLRVVDLPSGKIFAKQEIQAIEMGLAGLFFTGDGTGQVRVWKWLESQAQQQ